MELQSAPGNERLRCLARISSILVSEVFGMVSMAGFGAPYSPGTPLAPYVLPQVQADSCRGRGSAPGVLTAPSRAASAVPPSAWCGTSGASPARTRQMHVASFRIARKSCSVASIDALMGRGSGMVSARATSSTYTCRQPWGVQSRAVPRPAAHLWRCSATVASGPAVRSPHSNMLP